MKDYIPIKRETLSRFAYNARRLGGVDKDLSPDEMNSIFESVDAKTLLPDNVLFYYFGTAESVFDMGALAFSGSAVGELTE